MSLIEDINAKLKQAMLNRDQFEAGVFRDLKSAILYEEVAKNKRDEGLTDEEVETVVAREVKKRNDAIEAYTGAGDTERADKEAAERDVLQQFLPEQLSREELEKIISEKITETGAESMKDMGKVIGAVKQAVGNSASGAEISEIVKEKLK